MKKITDMFFVMTILYFGLIFIVLLATIVYYIGITSW